MDIIYDTTEAITLFIQEIKEKGDELQNRGYKEAANAAHTLHEGLTLECKNLFEGKQSVPSFSKNCKKLIETAAIPAVLGKSGCKGIGLKAFRKPLKAMDGFRERQDGFMRVCEKLLGQSPCWHSLFSAGMAVETAEESKLSDHRGFFGTIFHGIKVLFNAITFGAVSVTPTNSVAKLTEMKSALQKKEVLPPQEAEEDLALHP